MKNLVYINVELLPRPRIVSADVETGCTYLKLEYFFIEIGLTC